MLTNIQKWFQILLPKLWNLTFSYEIAFIYLQNLEFYDLFEMWITGKYWPIVWLKPSRLCWGLTEVVTAHCRLEKPKLTQNWRDWGDLGLDWVIVEDREFGRTGVSGTVLSRDGDHSDRRCSPISGQLSRMHWDWRRNIRISQQTFRIIFLSQLVHRVKSGGVELCNLER